MRDTFEDLGTRNATLPVVYQVFSEKEIERKSNRPFFMLLYSKFKFLLNLFALIHFCAVKISKIRLERMRLIDHEKDSVKLGEKSIRNLYETLWREEQELMNEDPPLISVS